MGRESTGKEGALFQRLDPEQQKSDVEAGGGRVEMRAVAHKGAHPLNG